MLTSENALQFAVMLQAGLPPSQAILYFAESDDPGELAVQLNKWMRSRAVKQAMLTLMKKPWQDMTLDERCRYALDQHYSQLAYLLHSEHYGEAGPTDKAKLDTARQAIEAKMAGMAGKTDALSQLLLDIKEGKLRVAKPLAAPLNVIPS
jgi:hypothetical protein